TDENTYQELLRFLIQNTSEFIRLFDADRNCVYANPAVERVMGSVPGGFADFAHPEDRGATIQWFGRVLAGSKGVLSWRIRRQDGEWRWIETQGAMVRYHGKPHVLTVCRDVTQRKQAHDTLQESHELLSQVLATLPVGAVVVDREGDIILANNASR